MLPCYRCGTTLRVLMHISACGCCNPGAAVVARTERLLRCQSCAPTRPQRRGIVVRAVDDEDPVQLSGDWRAFRAGLIAQTGGSRWSGDQLCAQNMQLLREQSPDLADEPVWAHTVGQVERGTLLLASVKAPGLLKDPRMWQLVIFVTEHGKDGSTGLILNRPAMPCLGDLLSAAKLQGDLATLERAFSSSTVYLGGMYSPNKMLSQRLTVLHPHEQLQNVSNGQLKPPSEVVPGIFLGGEIAAASLVEQGKLKADSFRFFAGMLEWGPGQLAMEVHSGIWRTAAVSRNLIVKQCLQLPVPLWQEITELLGSEQE